MHLNKIQSPQLLHWYAYWKKSKGVDTSGIRGANDLLSPEVDEMKDRLLILQNHYVVLQKKEEYTKQTLINSQSKWTQFSREILNISKELLYTVEAMGG